MLELTKCLRKLVNGLLLFFYLLLSLLDDRREKVV